MRKKEISLLFLIFLFFPLFIFAQEIEYPTIPGVPPPTPTTTFPEYVRYFFNFFVAIAGIVAFGVLIWGALLWFTSAGDPTQKARAKEKIKGAFLGLLVLLSSYIIITTLNPKLSIFKLKKTTAGGGIYLINSGGEKKYLFDTSQKIDFNNLSQIEFISPPEDLIEIYLYDKENFQGKREKITNLGAGSVISPSLSSVKSIYFVWAKPGLYLYDELNFNLNNFPHPLYIKTTKRDLGEWGRKAKSMRVIDFSHQVHTGAVLFTDKLEGECAIFFTTSSACDRTFIGDLSSTSTIGCGIYDNRYGMEREELNSLFLFSTDLTKTYSGKVIFYDKIDCSSSNSLIITPSLGATLGEFKDYIYSPTSSSGVTSTWEGKIESFKIEGPFKVVLIATSSSSWICQTGWKMDAGKCVGRLEGTSVYPPNSPHIRPVAFYIISAQ